MYLECKEKDGVLPYVDKDAGTGDVHTFLWDLISH